MIEKVIIMGAAGRDFHNHNVYFKGNPRYQVVAFTATQIPDIENRRYPPQLAGSQYPDGIPIHPEEALTDLIRQYKADLIAFSYSDIPHIDVMHNASLAMAEGADFVLIGAPYTMLKSVKTVVAVCAVRTGCGKSQTTRHVCQILKQQGHRVVAVRHPMPYGDLIEQEVQRFSCYDDFERHHCTIEEREEYESLVDQGVVVYAGIDYGKILTAAEKEGDIIVWDGGNNDTPFYHPDIHIVLFDPHRPGDELRYYPGETNMLMADIAVINKVDSAPSEGVVAVKKNVEAHNPHATIVLAESNLLIESTEQIRGKRVLVVEDGPTLTHGGMGFGAGMIAAKSHGAGNIVEVKPFATGTIKDTFESYPHLQDVLPAMGYSPQQMEELEQTINRTPCDLVLFATPIDLPKLLDINKPTLRVRYEYKDHDAPCLADILLECLGRIMDPCEI
jgi:predicted GTPase